MTSLQLREPFWETSGLEEHLTALAASSRRGLHGLFRSVPFVGAWGLDRVGTISAKHRVLNRLEEQTEGIRTPERILIWSSVTFLGRPLRCTSLIRARFY